MAEKMMEFQTRLGLQKISLDHVLRFPRGIIGYENKRDFALLRIREGSPFLILQSLEDPGLGLLVADPYSFVQDYSIRLNDVEQHMLHVSSPEQVSVLVTVSIPAGRPEETCLNLLGPVVVNHEARLGLQVPQSDPDQPAKVFLHKK
ncbi:MAG: flagellar assembly protein FliW [Desulfovibrionaceae bacterium]|nr:flagellar assembly protein FliW [Desulfovibrionaceae bacterium]